jgi:DNA-binding response OmpR family regulator
MPEHVLVVDDDPHIRGPVTEVLIEEGFAVASAANGREAMQHIAEDRPELVLLDLPMPVLTGWDVIRALHDAKAQVPIVLMSAGIPVRQEAARQHAAGYLAKPFALDDLVALVERITQRRTNTA